MSDEAKTCVLTDAHHVMDMIESKMGRSDKVLLLSHWLRIAQREGAEAMKVGFIHLLRLTEDGFHAVGNTDAAGVARAIRTEVDNHLYPRAVVEKIDAK